MSTLRSPKVLLALAIIVAVLVILSVLRIPKVAMPEITIPAGKDISGFDGTVSSIWVRGIVGTVQFSASFTYAFPR